MRVGEALKRARESKGVTQKQLAEKLYVDAVLFADGRKDKGKFRW